MLSSPARRESSHYLPAEAPPCWCEVCPVATGYTLRWSLSVVPGCLGNSRLCQQWACTSVGADCLGNGGRPSPTELRFQGTSPPGVFGIAILFVALHYPKRCVPGISWAGSLSKSCSVSSSALSSLRLPVQQGTQTSALLCGALWSAAALQCGPPPHLLQALPCCCCLRPAAVSALLPQAMPCGGVSLLWWVALATAGCVNNGSVPQ